MAHRTRPIIGINADFLAASKRTTAQVRLNVGYSDLILAAGGVPVVLPPLGKIDAFEEILPQLDGFILSGGLDMDPRRLGMQPHPSVQVMAERRDLNDRTLLKCLLERQTPLLAIGLGMQQLNVACGGTIFQHLPTDIPRSMPHFDPTGGPHRHAVRLQTNTRLDEIYGGDEMFVNSSHHQAVRQVGAGLRVCATAPDGVIEAIETTDTNWFCVGVQWHPESETASALDMQLLECFVQACLRQTPTLALAA